MLNDDELLALQQAEREGKLTWKGGMDLDNEEWLENLTHRDKCRRAAFLRNLVRMMEWSKGSGSLGVKRSLEQAKTRALKWVNKIRVDRLGLKPLQRLPRGDKVRMKTCPLARALPGVEGSMISNYTKTPRIRLDEPEYICDFIWLFDRGQYPELLRKPRSQWRKNAKN